MGHRGVESGDGVRLGKLLVVDAYRGDEPDTGVRHAVDLAGDEVRVVDLHRLQRGGRVVEPAHHARLGEVVDAGHTRGEVVESTGAGEPVHDLRVCLGEHRGVLRDPGVQRFGVGDAAHAAGVDVAVRGDESGREEGAVEVDDLGERRGGRRVRCPFAETCDASVVVDGEPAAEPAGLGGVDGDDDGVDEERAHGRWNLLGPAGVSDMSDDGQSAVCRNALLCRGHRQRSCTALPF